MRTCCDDHLNPARLLASLWWPWPLSPLSQITVISRVDFCSVVYLKLCKRLFMAEAGAVIG